MWLLNRVLGAFLFLAMAAIGAKAGDRALADVIGYSEDGRYFAFEEFGVQDGSGFAYSNIYVVDLTLDQWVVGTPVRVLGNDEEEELGEIRRKAMASALPRLDDLAIDRPAQTAALIGDGEPGQDGLSLEFGVPLGAEISGEYKTELEIFKTDAGSPCMEWFGEEAMGFALTISDFGVSREVHRDQNLPRSRGCPQTYKIYGIYLPFQATDISRAVALVSVYPYGFEGPDRRFVAVPLAFDF